jgi:hypothetical protein
MDNVATLESFEADQPPADRAPTVSGEHRDDAEITEGAAPEHTAADTKPAIEISQMVVSWDTATVDANPEIIVRDPTTRRVTRINDAMDNLRVASELIKTIQALSSVASSLVQRHNSDADPQ